MSCCKKSPEYTMYLSLSKAVLTETYASDLKSTFSSIFSWNDSKIETIVDVAMTFGECALFDVGHDEMLRLSKKLMKNNIPFSVKSKKK